MDAFSSPTLALQRFMLDQIPLARAIDLRIAGFDGQVLTMDAPLAPNVNDKGCAFGGSLGSVMTLAGWALVELTLRARGIDCDVYVGRSDITYRLPVWSDFRAEARLDAGATQEAFLSTLHARGRARTSVVCHLHERDKPAIAATLHAQFVAKRHAQDTRMHPRSASAGS